MNEPLTNLIPEAVCIVIYFHNVRFSITYGLLEFVLATTQTFESKHTEGSNLRVKRGLYHLYCNQSPF